MSAYSDQIRTIAPTYDPRHIEAMMRLQYSTLDRLSAAQFKREVLFCCICVEEDPDLAERCAKSFGL